MKFPPSLTPWASQLNVFHDDVSLTVGELVRRISAFVNPMKPLGTHENGEPNGYDGVARRGIYERLLLSELALADEFGDEFIRRAVMGEHLFLNLAKVAEGEKRMSVALFDAGAMQLGTPRLAQIAVFIVLARRAAAANAAFCWGILQDLRHLVLSDDTESSIRILLESRVARTVSQADLDEWSEKLASITDRSDVWLIGSEAIDELPGAGVFSRIFIDETLELDADRLRVSFRFPSRDGREILLDLPPREVCTHILRNPFGPGVLAKRVEVAADYAVNDFFFDGTGAKLFLRLSSSKIDCIDLQNVVSPTKPKTTRLEHESMPIIAVGRIGKSLAFATARDDFTVNVKTLKKKAFRGGSYKSDDQEIAFPSQTGEILRIFDTRPDKFHYLEPCLIDATGNLFLFEPYVDRNRYGDGIEGTLRHIATDVLDAVCDSQGMHYVGCRKGRAEHVLIAKRNLVEEHKLTGGMLRRAMFGRGDKGANIIGVEFLDGEWAIFDESLRERPMPRIDGEVIGVMKDSRFAPRPGLFAIGENRRTIEFHWDYDRRKAVEVVCEHNEIIRARVNPRVPILCYQTTAGDFVIYSLTRRRILHRFSR